VWTIGARMEQKIDLKAKKQYKPPVCPICHKVNLLGSKYCSDCMATLTVEAKQKVQNTTDQLRMLFTEHPEAQTILLQFLNELKK